MGRPVDLVVGAIHDMNNDRLAGWNAFMRSDCECEKLRAEVDRLKKLLKSRRSKNVRSQK
jgi:hypothetical protein